MSTEVDREAFMRLMGLTAADVADPDSAPKRATTRRDAPPPSAGGAAAAAAALHSASSCRRVSSSVSSSAAGLSHSASLRGDSEHISNSYTHAKISLQRSGAGGGGADTLRSSASPSAMEYSTAALKSGGRFVSAEALLRHRSEAAATVTSPRPTSVGEMLKEAGNEAFEAGRFVEAIQHYSAAIEAVSGDGAAASADTRVLLPATSDSTTTGRPCEVELLAALHSNRSAAYLQAARQWNSAEEAYGRALCDADRAVALRPSWFKGYSRQGDAYFKLRRYGTAAEAYEMALQLDPRNTTLANALAETRQRAKQSAREELELRRTLRSTGASSHMHRTRLSEERLDVQPLGGHNGGSTGYTTGGPRRSSGQAQQRWEELKHEVEATTHAPTGDAYRLQQLERFRQRGGTAAASTVSEARRSFASALKHDTTLAEWQSPPHHGPVSTSESRHTTPPTPAEAASLTTPSRPCNDRSSGGARDSSLPPTNTTAAAPATTTTNITTTSATSASLAPVPPPRRSTYESPTPGGIQAAMANFSGPVTSARDVPYEFSSAAASAYQQKLLEAFRQRKTKQP